MGMKKKRYLLLSAALVIGAALTVQAAGKTPPYKPQTFETASQNNDKNGYFWFPALYSDTSGVYLEPDSVVYKTDHADAQAITVATSDPSTFTDLVFWERAKANATDDYPENEAKKVEPATPMSFKFKITATADPKSKKYGEVKLVSAEAVKGFFGNPTANLVSIPEFVWAVQPVSGSDTLYYIYKVTEIAPDALSFLIGGGDGTEKNPYKYKKFYFGAIEGSSEDTTREDMDDILVEKAGLKSLLSGNGDSVFTHISFSTAMPKVSGALNFYGLLDDEAKVSLLPTRWNKDYANSNTSAYYGSAFFDGSYVTGAKQVKEILGFGMSGDKRDKDISLTDIERLTAALNSADAGATATHKLGGKSVTYKASKLKLILQGARGAMTETATDLYSGVGTYVIDGDAVAFPVKILDGAFTAAGFGDRFGAISFEAGLAGDLGTSGFGGISVSGIDAKDKDIEAFKTALGEKWVQGFDSIKFDNSNAKADNYAGLSFGGTGLFAGKTIGTLKLPNYLSEIGEGWFKGAEIGTIDTTDKHEIYKVSVIGKEAFAGAKIPSLADFGFGDTGPNSPYKVTGTNTDYFTLADNKAAVVLTIGKDAFAGAVIDTTGGTNATDGDSLGIDLSPLKWATTIGDGAFAGISQIKKGKEAAGTIVPDTIYPVLGFEKFAYVNKLGKDVFKGDFLHIDTTATTGLRVNTATFESTLLVPETITDSVYKLPFDAFIKELPAKFFDGVTLISADTAVVVIRTEGKADSIYKARTYATSAQKVDYAINSPRFQLPTMKAGEGIDQDALYGAVVYVPYDKFEGWKTQLEGSVVKAYGVGAISATGPTVKLVTSLGQIVGAVDSTGKAVGSDVGKIAKFVIDYGFNDDGKTTRILSFVDAMKNAAYYQIDGPAAAERLFPEKLGERHEISDDIKENGIVLAGGLPAGLYIIKTAAVDGKLSLASRLYIAPIDLSLVKIDTLTRTWVGEENLEALLSGITLDDITVRDLYKEDDIKDVTDEDVRLFPRDAEPKVGAATAVLTMRGLGNYTGEAQVILDYKPLDLSKAEIKLGDVEFTGNANRYPYPENGEVTVKSHGFDVKLAQDKDKDDHVTLDFTAPAKVGTVDVTVTAGESDNVIGTGTTTYTVQALWSKIAAVNDKVGYNLGETVYFNGLPKTFEGLVQPIYLEEGDYSLVAIKANENTLSTVTELGEYIEGELTEVGEYDFYIIPASEEYKTIYEGKKNATLVGTLWYTALPFEELKGAFEITLDDAKEYVLTLDESVYAGEYNAELNTAKTAFTVTLPEEALAGIEGLEEPTFEIAIPTALPTELHFDQPVKTLHEGESYDLAQHLIPNEGAKLDFLNDIEWTSSKDTKFTVDETGFITAIEEWEGSVTATVKGTEVSATINIHVILEGEDKPTSVIAAKDAKGVTYANGKLTVKGYADQTATLYRLNGTAAAKLNVTSDAATYDVKLTKGFYLVKTGSAITKIVVR
jgi:hypothetical protein